MSWSSIVYELPRRAPWPIVIHKPVNGQMNVRADTMVIKPTNSWPHVSIYSISKYRPKREYIEARKGGKITNWQESVLDLPPRV